MHGDAADVAVAELALAGVEARANRDPQGPYLVADCSCAVDAPSGSVEGGENAVPGALHRLTTVAIYLAADESVVLIEQISPAPVAERRRPLGRTHDVGEQNRGKHTVELAHRALAGEKLLNLVNDLVRVADPGPVVISRQLDEACARDLRGRASALRRPAEHRRCDG